MGFMPDIYNEAVSYREACGVANQKVEQLQAELDKLSWIPVSERLPEDNDTVFVVVQYENEIFSLIGRYSFINDIRKWEVYPETKLPTVTHWMPIILPEQALKEKGGKDDEIRK